MIQRRPKPLLKRHLLALALCSAAGLAQAQGAAPSAAADPAARSLEQLRNTTLALIDALVAQGLLSRERADALLRQAQSPAPAPGTWGAPPTGGSAAPVQRVPYLSETVREQLRDQIKLDVLEQARTEGWADSRAIPAWSRRITLDGDLRVRWQSERPDAANLPAEDYRAQIGSPAWAPDLLNTQTARERLTLRARLGVGARISDDSFVGLRLSTGATTGPSSASQTLGNQFNRVTFTLDRAFLRWEPRHDLRLIAGRMPNPFFASDLLWPDDVSMDGVAVQGERTLGSGVFAFGTLGVFPLEEFNVSRRDKWLYAAQAGVDWALGDQSQLRMAVALYDFRGVEGVREALPPPAGPRAGTVGYQTSQYPSSVRLKGNTLINLNDPTSTAAPVWGLASKFRPVAVTLGMVWRHWEPVHAGLTVEAVRNTAFDLADIRRRANTGPNPLLDGLQAKLTGLQVRGTVGMPRLAEKGHWQAFLALRQFERDAWIDGFTDTGWHGGGTNYRGFNLGGQYAFDRNTSIGLRYASTRNLDDGVRFLANPADPLSLSGNLSSAPLRIETVQIDVSTRF